MAIVCPGLKIIVFCFNAYTFAKKYCCFWDLYESHQMVDGELHLTEVRRAKGDCLCRAVSSIIQVVSVFTS